MHSGDGLHLHLSGRSYVRTLMVDKEFTVASMLRFVQYTFSTWLLTVEIISFLPRSFGV